MKEVIVKFEPFVLNQTIFIKDGEGNVIKKEIPQKELPSYLSLLSDASKVHFFGNKKFVEKIKTECVTKYNMNNVKIVINE